MCLCIGMYSDLIYFVIDGEALHVPLLLLYISTVHLKPFSDSPGAFKTTEGRGSSSPR